MKCNKNCVFCEDGQCQPVDQEDFKNTIPDSDQCPVFFANIVFTNK